MENTYIAHHGILGQKWGVRRFQNPDGSLTDVGKKRYYKELKKSYNKQKDSSRPYLISEKTKEIIRSNVSKSKILESDDIKEDIKELTKLKNKFIELDSKTVDFYESNALNDASSRAYDRTYKWFEKNEPTYLKEIIKKNNGEKAGLDGFHDFRKVFEGYEDDEWGKALEVWSKSPEGQSRKLADDAWDDYYNKTKEVGAKVSNSLLGIYGNKKLNSLSSETYGDLVSDNVRDILDEKTKNIPKK